MRDEPDPTPEAQQGQENDDMTFEEEAVWLLSPHNDPTPVTFDFINDPPSTFTVTDVPMEVAGNLYLIRIDDGPVPIAACFDKDAAQRIANLLNEHSLWEPSEFDWGV